jgi:hypothetical protein
MHSHTAAVQIAIQSQRRCGQKIWVRAWPSAAESKQSHCSGPVLSLNGVLLRRGTCIKLWTDGGRG